MKIWVSPGNNGDESEVECFFHSHGLAVVQAWIGGQKISSHFRIIHIESGQNIESWLFSRVDHAVSVIEKLLPLMDWEQSTEDLKRDLRQNLEQSNSLRLLFREIGNQVPSIKIVFENSTYYDE